MVTTRLQQRQEKTVIASTTGGTTSAKGQSSTVLATESKAPPIRPLKTPVRLLESAARWRAKNKAKLLGYYKKGIKPLIASLTSETAVQGFLKPLLKELDKVNLEEWDEILKRGTSV